MAAPRKMASGRWSIQIKIRGVRESATFDTKREAVLWAARRRLELNAAARGHGGDVFTLRDAMQRYAKEVAPTHRGARWEQVRLTAFEGQPLPLTLPLSQITAQHMTTWRQWRETQVGANSVRREMSLLGSVFTAARRDWHWIQHSPMSDVRRPAVPPPRKRLLSQAEIKGMLRALGYRRQRPQTMRQVVAHMALLSLRAGMRSGEMEALTWDNVYDNYVTLEKTKNGYERDVPLSRKARPIIERMRGWDDVRVFPVSAQSRDSLWRSARDRAGLSGFTFHDCRHVAATRIGATVGQPGRLSFPEFCAMFGWRDPRNAMIYVNPRAGDLADKL